MPLEASSAGVGGGGAPAAAGAGWVNSRAGPPRGMAGVLDLRPQSHHVEPPPKNILSPKKTSVVAMLTEFSDKSRLLGYIAVPKSLQYWNSLAKSLEWHFSTYLRLPTGQSLRLLVKMQKAGFLQFLPNRKVRYSHNSNIHQSLRSACLIS